MKLTKAQANVLLEIRKAGMLQRRWTCVTTYKPTQVLLKLGLVTQITKDPYNNAYDLTAAGSRIADELARKGAS